MQGDVFGPIECSVQVDSFGKECLEEDKYLYSYKDSVKIPILSMVDDALLVSECGYKSAMLNTFINTKTNIKKLQYGTAKCFKMHLVGKCIEEVCPDLLFFYGWKLRDYSVEDEYTGQVSKQSDGKNARE